MSESLLESLSADGILTLTLNRPKKRNALSIDLREALQTAFGKASADQRVKCVVLLGSGNHFCAGGDLATMGDISGEQAAQRMNAVADVVLSIASCEKPIVAGINGYASGAGVGLALLADFVIASDDAKFSFSFLRVNLGPDWGLSYTLPLRVGFSRARRLLLELSTLSSQEAFEFGLTDRIVANDNLEKTVNKYATDLAGRFSNAMGSVKKQMSDIESLRDTLLKETACQVGRFTSDEHRDALQRFVGK